MQVKEKTQTMFTISDVHRLTGKARSTITNHMKKGDLSFVKGSDGRRMVEASELARAYGDELELGPNGQLKAKPKDVNNGLANDGGERRLENLLEFEKRERERERRQLESTIEHLRSDLEKSQDRENRVALLLEDHSKGSDRWVKQMSDLEKRVANQERDVEKYRRALVREKSKTFWQRIFD